MLYTTLQDALNALSSTPATTDALMSLVQQASIDATGAITIFYSGNVGDVNAGSIVNSATKGTGVEFFSAVNDSGNKWNRL